MAVLDMAGTTVRDDGAVESAFVEALAGMDVDAGAHLEYVRSSMGQSKIVVFRHVFGGDEGRATEANQRFEDAFAGAVARGEVEPLPGAEDAITTMRSAGVRVCLTTGFSGRTRDLLLDSLGWRDRVDLALSPGDGVRGRPFPDLVLAAVMRLEIGAVQEVAVAGDTASDLEAGTRAGAAIVAGVLTGAHSREQLLAAPHTHLLTSVTELPLVALR